MTVSLATACRLVVTNTGRWIRGREVLSALEAAPDRGGIRPDIKLDYREVIRALAKENRTGGVQRRGSHNAAEWAAVGLPGADADAHLARQFGRPIATGPAVRISVRVPAATAALLDRWSRLSGVALDQLVRTTCEMEAMRWVIQTQNVPNRLSPGVPVFRTTRSPALDGTGGEFALEFFATGEERVWVIDLVTIDAPPVSPDGRAYVIDVVSHGANRLVRASGVVFTNPRHVGESALAARHVSSNPPKPEKVEPVSREGRRLVASVAACPVPSSPSPTTASSAVSSSSA